MDTKDQILSLNPNAPEGFTDEQRAFVGGQWLEVDRSDVDAINAAMEATGRFLRVAAREDTSGSMYLNAGLLVDTVAGRPLDCAAEILQGLNIVADSKIEWPAPTEEI